MPSSPEAADKMARNLISLHEGRKKYPYLCPSDKITIGIGRNLEDVGLSEKEIDFLFANDLRTARATCRKLFCAFHEIDEPRQAALLDMAFNLGEPRLALFRNMRQAVDERDWWTAAKEAADSKWFDQVGNRARTIVKIFETGRWPSEIDRPRREY